MIERSIRSMCSWSAWIAPSATAIVSNTPSAGSGRSSSSASAWRSSIALWTTRRRRPARRAVLARCHRDAAHPVSPRAGDVLGVSPITIVFARGWGPAEPAGPARRRAIAGSAPRSSASEPNAPGPAANAGPIPRAVELQLRHALEVAGQQADDDVVARGQPLQQLGHPADHMSLRDRPDNGSRRSRSRSGGRRRRAHRSSPRRLRRRAGSPVRSRRRSARRWRTDDSSSWRRRRGGAGAPADAVAHRAGRVGEQRPVDVEQQQRRARRAHSASR